MKKLSDYKGEEAIELWGDLLEPIVTITSDDEVAKAFRSTRTIAEKAKVILKTHKKEACDILTRIDPTPIDGLNIVIRLVELLMEIEKNPDLKDFFILAETE